MLTQVNEWYRSASATIGVDPDYTQHLYSYLKEAGFTNIKEQIVDIPIGEWPTTDCKSYSDISSSSDTNLILIIVAKQHGYLYKEQMRALFKSMKRWWCTEIKVSQQEYDQVCSEALEEFEEFQSTARWKIFTATKPFTTAI